MTNFYLAKSKPKETIGEHTELLLENLYLLKDLYPGLEVNWDVLELAVIFHDVGKLNPKFQNKLYKTLELQLIGDGFKDRDEIPHGNISTAFLDRKKLMERFDKATLKILYQSIFYHHPRYMEKEDFNYFKEYLTQAVAPEAMDFPMNHWFFRREPIADFKQYTDKRIDYRDDEDEKKLFYKYVMVKGLLNRLDYASSAHIPVEKQNSGLEKKTLAYLQTLGPLRDIQVYLKEWREENQVIIASTGIGKTEAGLLWIRDSKGFFTLPLRVSINGIYKRIKTEKIGFEETALLHSDALAFLVKSSESMDYIKEYTRARQLSMPLTITTIDQLFKFVFKEEGFESILATLSYSRVIIDEIQMYSPDIIACIIAGLKYITDIGGKFIILTATFPPVISHFMQKQGIKFGSRQFILDKKRHLVDISKIDINEAVPWIIEKGKESKVLVIVNTVKKAQELFGEIAGGMKGEGGENTELHLLHSRFIKKDRHRLEHEIMDFSEGGGCGIWVTTQIVEASLDIDFDYLFTELSTVDGLFQRMGRCYRKREISGDRVEPNVYVFTGGVSGLGKIIDSEIFQLSMSALQSLHHCVVTEEQKMAVVDEVYSLEKIRDTSYYKDIRARLELLENLPAFELERKEVDEKFRNIRSYTVIPISIYRDEQEKIHEWIKELEGLGFSDRERIRRIELVEMIKDFTVDVPSYMKKNIVDHFSVDKKNKISIVDLEYDSQMGIQSQGGSSNFM